MADADKIKMLRKRYADLPGKAAKIAINKRAAELMRIHFSIEMGTRNDQNIWIKGKRGYTSTLEPQWVYCYATAFLEQLNLERKAAAAVMELAASNN